MSKDTAVAVWKNGCLTVLNYTLLPLCFKKNTNAESWLATRAIDSHRANSRLLKKALRLRTYTRLWAAAELTQQR